MVDNYIIEVKEKVIKRLENHIEIDDDLILNMIDDILLLEMKEAYISLKDKEVIRTKVFNSIRRLDELQELLDDDSITEIMINGECNIFIERNGRISMWDRTFESKQKLLSIIQQMISKSNRMINESSPIVDSRLPDGSRVNVVLSPVAINGPIVTIRKFPKESITMDKLIEYGAISETVAIFLRALVISGYNIFISGGTGSGKTTFLNALSNYIPKDERIITIEDSAELQIKNVPNLVRLEARNSNVEGKNQISIRDLIKSALRMRPDRIIVGEVRDEAAIDMLQAMNSGHDGSLSTGHANSSIDMLNRLETLVLMGTDIPLIAVRKQIASAIDIIIHLGRLRDKSRKVLEISEVLGCVDGEIEINKLYVYKEQSESSDGKVEGELMKTSNELINLHKLSKAGVL